MVSVNKKNNTKSYQFLAWPGLHVIRVRIRILQRVATLKTRGKSPTQTQ